MPSYEPVRLPEQSKAQQASNKSVWNLLHTPTSPDFFTIGYEGRSISEFVDILKSVGVVSLVDVRHTPVSPHKPAFTKGNLQRILAEHGIAYLHRPELGVPREIRQAAVGEPTRDAIWDWYDANVVPVYFNGNLHQFLNSVDHPVALMCVEQDPTACHRHRIFMALARSGLQGYDL